MNEPLIAVRQRFPVTPGLSRVGVVATGLLCGWLVVRGHVSSTLVGCTVALVGLAVVTSWNPGVAAGLLVLVVMNGLPGIDLQPYLLPGDLRLSDGAVMLLVSALILRVHARGAPRGPWTRRFVVSGLVLGAWWLIVLLRTSLFEGVPPIKAFLVGRDFVYFAILLPLLTLGLRSRRELVGCLWTFFCGALLFSFGEIGISAVGAPSSGWAGWFVHASASADESHGVTRVYATMGDALAPIVAFGLGLALMPPRKRFARTAGIVLFIVGSIAMLYSLTRALYVGVVFALLVTVIVWLLAGGSRNAARRAIALFCTVLLVIVVIINYRSLTSPVSGAASMRVSSVITDFRQRTGTVEYRYQLDQEMLDVLGSRWIGGLGFLHPESHPVAALPDGSIRNTDVGVMNSVMTMGVVGTALLYFAPVVILLAVLRRWRALTERDRARNVEWFFFGATMWLVLVLVTSISLVTLFSVSGLAMSAMVLACTARLMDETRQDGA